MGVMMNGDNLMRWMAWGDFARRDAGDFFL